jgi:hypothetical protein
MELCVRHVDVHRAENVAGQSKIKFVQVAINLLKSAHVNPKNRLFFRKSAL